ncbi:hypothetical protein E5843_10105 [Luteimonas yindakuii]|uniref:hypothetical protein n=1 Tax=Luteimonas yindakuii TaxID=2565782 RepID=UPI0010A2DFD3|nr:hypothetical protein [Luteimonas yindakuii]QCO68027.1 hypothetical protein E5843_10105 [Luteimonas yindakuii]
MALKSLKDHAISASLARMQELLRDEAFVAPAIAADEIAQFNRDKIQNITKSLRSLVGQSPATMVSDTALNQMNSHLQAPINELTAFVANTNAGHLANAVAQLDQNVLSYTWAFLPKINPLSKAEAGEVVDYLQERSRQTIEQLDGQKEQLASTIARLTEVTQTQEASLKELKESQALLKAEMAASLSNLETSFNKAQLQRDTDFSELVNDSKEELAKSERNFKRQADAVIESLEKHKVDAARIVQVVGDIGVTGNYQNIANNETGQANLWRWITIALFASGLIMAGITFYKFYHEPVTTTNTLAIAVRLLYALAIAAPAFYTARESARHRTNADRARQTELELASLGPFIELMKDEDKEEIRKSLIRTYFGRSVDPHEIKNVLNVGTKQ